MLDESRSAESSEELALSLIMRHRLTSIGLAEALFDFCQETEPFDRIFERGSVRKALDDLKDLLFDRSSSHG